MISALLLCAVMVSVFAPSVFAASMLTGKIVGGGLYCRNGPGMSYEKILKYEEGSTIQLYPDAVTADGYTWYQTPDGWVPHTGYLQISSNATYTDTIQGWDGEGVQAWYHRCTSTNPDFKYHLEVHSDHYFIRCDCGWWYKRIVTSHFNSNFDGSQEALSFIGLDTDNDERVDLKPGQSKTLPNRANSDLLSYQILEFYDVANRVTPTVQLNIYHGETLYTSFEFYWQVDVKVEKYGLLLTDWTGNKKIHYIDGDFLVYDPLNRLYLGDNIYRYSWKIVTEDGVTIHMPGGYEYVRVYNLRIDEPGSGANGPLEWVIHIIRSVGEFISDILDFFGLGFIFTDNESPFKFLMGG